MKMSDYFNLDPTIVVNDLVDDLHYFNRDVVEAKNFFPYHTITSVDNFRYTHISGARKYYNEIFSQAYKNNVSKEAHEALLTSYILSGPVLNYDIGVYYVCSNRHIMNMEEKEICNMGFIDTSFELSTAEYKYRESDTEKTVMYIKIYKSTHFLDISSFCHVQPGFCKASQGTFSCILLDKSTCFIVDKVEKDVIHLSVLNYFHHEMFKYLCEDLKKAIKTSLLCFQHNDVHKKYLPKYIRLKIFNYLYSSYYI